MCARAPRYHFQWCSNCEVPDAPFPKKGGKTAAWRRGGVRVRFSECLFFFDIGERRLGPDIPVRDQP